MLHSLIPSPITVGGVGGSGTRLVTELLKQMGIFMGNVLNESNDNMQLANSFPTFRRLIQNKEYDDSTELDSVWKHIPQRFLRRFQDKKFHRKRKQIIFQILTQFQEIMLHDFALQSYNGWGWKVPGNFLILEYLAEYFDNLKYIHIIRHGLDIAYSSNQNQMHNWGKFYGIDIDRLPLPKASLRYWIRANKIAVTKGNQLLKERFLLLNFDTLCQNPYHEIQQLVNFLGLIDIDVAKLSQIVKIPDSLARYKQHDLSIFDNTELEEVKKLGFTIDFPG